MKNTPAERLKHAIERAQERSRLETEQFANRLTKKLDEGNQEAIARSKLFHVKEQIKSLSSKIESLLSYPEQVSDEKGEASHLMLTELDLLKYDLQQFLERIEEENGGNHIKSYEKIIDDFLNKINIYNEAFNHLFSSINLDKALDITLKTELSQRNQSVQHAISQRVAASMAMTQHVQRQLFQLHNNSIDEQLSSLEEEALNIQNKILKESMLLTEAAKSQEALQQQTAERQVRLNIASYRITQIEEQCSNIEGIESQLLEAEQQMQTLQSEIETLSIFREQVIGTTEVTTCLAALTNEIPVLIERANESKRQADADYQNEEQAISTALSLLNHLPSQSEIDELMSDLIANTQQLEQRLETMTKVQASELTSHLESVNQIEERRAETMHQATQLANTHTHKIHAVLMCADPSSAYNRMFWSEVRLACPIGTTGTTLASTSTLNPS